MAVTACLCEPESRSRLPVGACLGMRSLCDGFVRVAIPMVDLHGRALFFEEPDKLRQGHLSVTLEAPAAAIDQLHKG